jgi:hypothetical protein
MRSHGERVSTSYSWKLLGALPGVETELTRKEGQGMRRPPHRASGFVGQMPRAGSDWTSSSPWDASGSSQQPVSRVTWLPAGAGRDLIQHELVRDPGKTRPVGSVRARPSFAPKCEGALHFSLHECS